MELNKIEWITGFWAIVSLVFSFFGLYILMGISLLLFTIGLIIIHKTVTRGINGKSNREI
jgi:hypothetical protein